MELFGVYIDPTLFSDVGLWFLFICAVIFLLNALYYKFNFNEPIIKNFAINFTVVTFTLCILHFFQEDLKIASYQFSFSLSDVLRFIIFPIVNLYILYVIIKYLFKLIGKVFGFSSESQSSEKSYRKFSSYEEAVRVQNYKPKSFRQMLNDYFWIIVIVVGILIMTILYYIYSPYQNCLRNSGLNGFNNIDSNKELSYSRNVQNEGWNIAIKLMKKEYKKYCSALNSW